MRAMRWYQPDDASPENEPINKESLEQRLQALQSEMAAITKQLDQLEEGKEEAAENDPL
jgi:prefoldin subunit 5